MTYETLNVKANQVARLLKNEGVQRGDIIGLLMGENGMKRLSECWES